MDRDEAGGFVTDEAALRSRYRDISDLRRQTVLDRLDEHCRNFIANSPFLVLATGDLGGAIDASPRGDAPGFVRVLDDHTLLIPDRKGNNRLDSMSNVVANAHVGLLFLIPGIGETLRVNGEARIVTDDDVLATMAVDGKTPTAALRVDVREAFLHCAKALIRSRLWEDEHRLERPAFPTLGKMLADQIDADVATTEDRIATGYAKDLY